MAPRASGFRVRVCCLCSSLCQPIRSSLVTFLDLGEVALCGIVLCVPVQDQGR